jgi:transcriptional regulator with XRE-family HTH domain
MLSAYETGKQKPSLDTLEKILDALDCTLNDLHNALQIVNERPEAIRRPGGREGMWTGGRRDPQDLFSTGERSQDVYHVLGINRPIPPIEEQALSEMLQGFHRLVRYFHDTVSQTLPQEPESETEPT